MEGRCSVDVVKKLVYLVSTVHVEAALTEYPYLRECAVVGVPRGGVLGHALVAVAVPIDRGHGGGGGGIDRGHGGGGCGIDRGHGGGGGGIDRGGIDRGGGVDGTEFDDSVFDVRALRRFLSTRLEKHAWVDKVIWVPYLPRNSMGKVVKKTLLDDIAALPDLSRPRGTYRRPRPRPRPSSSSSSESIHPTAETGYTKDTKSDQT